MSPRYFNLALILALVLAALAPATLAGAGNQEPAEPGMNGMGYRRDDHTHPREARQRDLRLKAIEALLNGTLSGAVVEVEPGYFVELELAGEDALWTVLGEFSDFYHNSIPEPDRDYDNTTLWAPDFSPQYYTDLLFAEGAAINSMREFYLEQSSGRYTVYGDVGGWITVPGKAADYDDGDPVGPSCGPCVWQFLDDSVDGWYQQQLDAGLTAEQIDAYLSQYDVWDRYDYDHDGNFTEPDGYIDRFQSVHAGEGNEAGGGELGDHAIWSHSWYAYYNLEGQVGPEFNPAGGLQVGESAYWIGKYTIQPENGGVGVFAHEYGHDLGLPDLYDYSGENSTGFWTLMSSGSWLSDGTVDIGSKPSHLGAWEKLQLGWLNYIQIDGTAAGSATHLLGPVEYNSTAAQGLVVTLPEKYVTAYIGTPYEGEYLFYSGAGDELDNFMVKAFVLEPGASFSAMVNYDIETDWDYAYLVVSTDQGATWESVATNLSTTTDPNYQNLGYGITGGSGGWVALSADLSAYSGEALLGFRYKTDEAVSNPGFMADNLVVGGYASDGGEEETGWTYTGFVRTTEELTTGPYFNAYVSEFRQYTGYDEVLRSAYNFFWTGSTPYYNWVERYPYQDGLLIHYWDSSFSNNDVGTNCAAGRCGGLLLPVDAHPEVLYRSGGQPWRNRVQTYDSTFGLEPTDPVTLHYRNYSLRFRDYSAVLHSLPANPLFDDNLQYYRAENPLGGVINPHTGTQIEVLDVSDYSSEGAYMEVRVTTSDHP